MPANQNWSWTFMGFHSPEAGRIVQTWFNGLPSEAKAEITDILQGLQVVTARRWRMPEFNPLKGAGGISEIRPDNVRSDRGCETYRIYGFFGPEQRQYTLLHGTLKTERNDRDGKRIAAERRDYVIFHGDSAIHEFDF
jgi:Phage derived protein Gp49-like (DUF891)